MTTGRVLSLEYAILNVISRLTTAVGALETANEHMFQKASSEEDERLCNTYYGAVYIINDVLDDLQKALEGEADNE